jgi:hypothetical protein
MAIISKALTDNGRNAVLKGLTSGGFANIGAITKISAKTSSGEGPGHDFFPDGATALTWGTISSGSVSVSGTPILNISAGITITHIALLAFDSGVFNDYVNMVLVAIDSETFTYAGTITITACTLTVSATLT